jgi:hypothetical protein
MKCAIEYEENEIRKTSSASGLLTGRGGRTYPFQTPQEFVGQNRPSRQLGVPLVQNRSNGRLRVSRIISRVCKMSARGEEYRAEQRAPF